MARILIIDDDSDMSDMLVEMVKNMGHEAHPSFSIEDGLAKASERSFDVVFLDVRLPDGNGLDALPKIQSSHSSPEVIIITGFGDPDGAELAIKNGAWDYIEKPSSLHMMTLPLVRALQYRKAKQFRRLPLVLQREDIIGSSVRTVSCMELLAQAAASDVNVLITGETGTGKELFARAIHQNSPRADGNFITVDCAALPPTIVESVLFGHEKGAFTGADKPRDGLIKQADGGTLFLDEVGELSLPIQKAFLRTLQERRFRPLGSKAELKSDFRLVGATNRNLDEMVRSGSFRQDLLFRIRAITIELPPLRENIDDIKELVFHYTAKLCKRFGIGTKGFSPEFLEALTAYDWPGNIREFVHTMERALTVARDEPTLFPKHLPTEIRVKLARSSITREDPHIEEQVVTPELQTFHDYRKNMDTQYLQRLMDHARGNIREACRISGLSRSHLYSLLKELEILQSG